MGSQLLIVESPSKAKTLKKYLGKDFEVLASYGHVRDLVPKTGAVDPEDGFRMRYELIERNAKHVEAITKAVKAARRVLLATDPDREGEAIAWHLAEILKAKRALKGKELGRVVFYEITEGAVKEAVDHPREISMALVNAQQARRALDYLVGFNLSPLLWKKIRRGLSAGRVQSPALRLIVERETEIENFRSREYWSVHFDSEKSGQPFTARLTHFKGEKLDAFAIGDAARNAEITEFLERSGKGAARVIEAEKKRRLRAPAAPFTTSTLQQEAVRKLGFSTDRTMKVAQSLYEGVSLGKAVTGLITYMRTDSVSLSKEAVAEIRGYITKHFGTDYLPKSPVTYRSTAKNAQEAHEAIRPTSIARTPESVAPYLNDEQRKLYEMIWKRSLACQMTPAKFDMVAVDFAVGGPSNIFRATGQTMVFAGFYAVYHEDEDDGAEEEDKRLPPLEKGDSVAIAKLYGEQHFTQPPPRFSEASLVKALEQHGIGRPSTYASIISTLQNREYVTLEKKRFQPTDVGRVVTRFLTEHFTHWVDYDFTARLEDELDDVSNGKSDWIPVLERFWRDFSAQVGAKESVSRKEVTQEALDETCPKCNAHPLAIRLGRRGRFVGCSGFPDCDYTRNLDGSGEASEAPAREMGVDPQSGKAIVLLQGPYGPYFQLGEAEGKAKPKRVSLPKDTTPEAATLDLALKLLALPRDLGAHPDTSKKVIAGIGRFGPYVNHDGQFKSIPKGESVFDITLERAVALLKEPRSPGGRGALRVLGKHPNDGQAVSLYAGRYGPYVKHGKVNATIPDKDAVDTLSLEEALTLLSAKAKRPGKTGRMKRAA